MATDYSKTVHLPRTDFPMRADLPKREPGIQEWWEKNEIYRRMRDRTPQGSYVLHDGPPYANGHIHIGHALNKILKDLVVKSRSLMGNKAPYVPGWDCHGLPIETALLKEMKKGKRDIQDVPAFRRQAKEFAEKFIDIQRGEFRRLGVLGEWEKPYVTMSHSYEAGTLEAFRRLLLEGYIYRGLKSVSWCFFCETALAEAEIEYKEKESPSIYAALPVKESTALRAKELDLGAEVLVWTTTPWTLPANMAVAFHPDLEYVLVEVRLGSESNLPHHPLPQAGEGSRKLLLARVRLDAVLEELKATKVKELGTWLGRDLAPRETKQSRHIRLACRAPYPFAAGGESIGVLADFVTAEDGTGVVHVAPGHGADDFETGLWYGLKIFSPVDGSGRFSAQAPDFQGVRVFPDGNERVMEDLRGRKILLHAGRIRHSYPHCWRCKNPIIFRATEQWFLNVGHEGLRQKLLKAIDGVQWIPPEGRTRISTMVQNRPDWCISRQRVWGTPIPILYCASCGKPSSEWPAETLSAFLAALIKRVEREGSDFWSEHLEKNIAASGELHDAIRWDFLPEGLECECGGKLFKRETDILDVWVDSGASWLSAMGGARSDIYLEGSDQHRGWFQSSLVLSVALTGQAPYKTVLTHGFVTDEKGRAMHKSLGNVVSPQDVIKKSGADVLRLWVALADYSDDVRLSEKLLEVPTEAYRKIRNTLRYLLGNLFDFDPAKDSAALDSLPEMDRYILHRLEEASRQTVQAYEEFRFRDAARALTDFCNLELSSFYLDACKDKLYTLAQNAPERRASQTAMFILLRSLIVLVAPILSFTAEEAWAEMRRMLAGLGSSEALPESVFLARFPSFDQQKIAWNEDLDKRWSSLLEIRQRVNKAIEEKRAAGALGSSLQALVRLKGGLRDLIERYKNSWPEILIVSQVEIAPDGNELSIEVSKALGAKCARCWRYQTDVGSRKDHPDLCSRCVSQLAAQGS